MLGPSSMFFYCPLNCRLVCYSDLLLVMSAFLHDGAITSLLKVEVGCLGAASLTPKLRTIQSRLAEDTLFERPIHVSATGLFWARTQDPQS